MESIKICMNNAKFNSKELDIIEAHEENGNLTLKLDKLYSTEDGYNKCDVSYNDAICLRRFIRDEELNSLSLSSEYSTTVISTGISQNHFTVTIKAPENLKLLVSSIEKVIEGGVTYCKFTFSNDTKVYPQDIYTFLQSNIGKTFDYIDTNTNETNDIFLADALMFAEKDNREYLPLKLALFKRKYETTLNDCDGVEEGILVTPDYYYVPDFLIRNVIYVNEDYTANTEKAFNFIYAPFNEYYYKTNDGVCHFWEELDKETFDEIGAEIEEEGIYDVDCIYRTKDKEYDVNTLSKVENDRFYYSTKLGLSENTDYNHLYQEENITNEFINKIKGNIVDEMPVIDMEKVKFSPTIKIGNDYLSVCAITFNLHFRTRTDLENSWSYDTSTGATYWNGIQDYSAIDDNNIKMADVLYYLGFTDDDVKNQKAKLKKSFLRLSFYDSTNPLTQKLLYYSTIFFDSGELFGKYIKAKQELIKMGYKEPRVVLQSSALTKNRLDASFVIQDEYHYENSSEGFNIYYFPSDVLTAENQEKTIYMKVEFNHAGFGRTIPMINVYDGEDELHVYDDIFKRKSLEERLYIDLKLKYINGEYVYLIDEKNSKSIDIDNQNHVINFYLFEPRITS